VPLATAIETRQLRAPVMMEAVAPQLASAAKVSSSSPAPVAANPLGALLALGASSSSQDNTPIATVVAPAASAPSAEPRLPPPWEQRTAAIGDGVRVFYWNPHTSTSQWHRPPPPAPPPMPPPEPKKKANRKDVYPKPKAREVWTTKEHEDFKAALALHGREWKLLGKAVGTKTVQQCRSHAQKWFKRIQRENLNEIIPPSLRGSGGQGVKKRKPASVSNEVKVRRTRGLGKKTLEAGPDGVLNKSSEYRGVNWHRSTQKWHSQIQFKNAKKHLGLFDDEKEAAKRYDEEARVLQGKDARPNFPLPGEVQGVRRRQTAASLLLTFARD
jgi:SHAQKYF class myb-like DNA-binding protein